jgi:hypothetical protein
VPGFAEDHPALRIHETSRATICADQFPESEECRIYEWPAMAAFLARTMDKLALRSESDPNYEGVDRMLAGREPERKRLELLAGTLNVFKGKNTAHRTVSVQGDRKRITAVFSYYERPGVLFTLRGADWIRWPRAIARYFPAPVA